MPCIYMYVRTCIIPLRDVHLLCGIGLQVPVSGASSRQCGDRAGDAAAGQPPAGAAVCEAGVGV